MPSDDFDYIVGGYLCATQLHTGRGGSTVWRGHGQEGEVLIKITPIPVDPEVRAILLARCDIETKCGQSLNGRPHIRRLLRHGRDDNAKMFNSPRGVVFQVFEYVPYGTLRTRLGRGVLGASELKALARSVCCGLAWAHCELVSHRDVKPENILIPDGDCRLALLADFGIALIEGGTRLTTYRSPGTPRYMAPEQFGEPAAGSGSADQYSTALVLWEAATHIVPWGEGTERRIHESRQRGESLPELEVEGITAPHLRACLGKALSPDPSGRFKDMNALFRDIASAGKQDGLWDREAARSVREVLESLHAGHLEVIDKRERGGALWVVGGEDLADLMVSVGLLGVDFRFAPEGGGSTKRRPAWWTADRR